MIESLVEQIEARFAELSRAMTDPEVIGDRQRYAEVGREYRAPRGPGQARRASGAARADDAAGRAGAARRGRRGPRGARDAGHRAPAPGGARRGDPPGHGRARPGRRQGRDRRDPGRRGRRGGRAVGRRRLPDAHQVRRAPAASRSEPLEVGDGKYTFAIKGDGAYSVFKYEGGTHRVQRVPVTESQGRIHTSTATVAVLPEAEDVDVQVDPNDLQIDVYRSSGPGGQSVNTTDSAVRITHKPSGHRRLDAGREEPAAEPREGDARAARAPLRAGAGRAAGRAGRRPPRPGRHRRPRREDPHLQLRRAPRHRPPHQAHRPQPRRGARGRARRVHRRRCRPTRSAAGSRRRPPPS